MERQRRLAEQEGDATAGKLHPFRVTVVVYVIMAIPVGAGNLLLAMLAALRGAAAAQLVA